MAEAAAAWAGAGWGGDARERLERYVRWLKEEAITSGALGPHEAGRLWTRHIGDSLTFAVGWKKPPDRLLDLGSGAGLPGIPLAVLWPETAVTVVDRSSKRADSLARLARILRLGNVSVQQLEAEAVSGGWPALVSRATFEVSVAMTWCARLLAPTGQAVLGWLRRSATPAEVDQIKERGSAQGLKTRIAVVPPTLLDGPSSLLIIAPRE